MLVIDQKGSNADIRSSQMDDELTVCGHKSDSVELCEGVVCSN